MMNYKFPYCWVQSGAMLKLHNIVTVMVVILSIPTQGMLCVKNPSLKWQEKNEAKVLLRQIFVE
jgi:hypothetical protein